jgi:hypothetical protein
MLTRDLTKFENFELLPYTKIRIKINKARRRSQNADPNKILSHTKAPRRHSTKNGERAQGSKT